MPYTIGSVIYGIVLYQKTWKALSKKYGWPRDGYNQTYDEEVLEKLGFTLNGYGIELEVSLGVKLGEIDETQPVRVRKIPKVTQQAKDEWARKLAKLPAEIQAAMPKPKWLIVWRTS